MATVWIYVDTKKRAPDPGAKYYLSRFGAHDLGRNPTLKLAMYKPLSRIAAPGSRC
jgi:hypothetical protein